MTAVCVGITAVSKAGMVNYKTNYALALIPFLAGGALFCLSENYLAFSPFMLDRHALVTYFRWHASSFGCGKTADTKEKKLWGWFRNVLALTAHRCFLLDKDLPHRRQTTPILRCRNSFLAPEWSRHIPAWSHLSTRTSSPISRQASCYPHGPLVFSARITCPDQLQFYLIRLTVLKPELARPPTPSVSHPQLAGLT